MVRTPVKKIKMRRLKPDELSRCLRIFQIVFAIRGKPTEHPCYNWCEQDAAVEFPLGELTGEPLKIAALTGFGTHRQEVCPIVRQDKFNAQGLEGKCRVHKNLFMAIMNLDVLPKYRGQVVVPRNFKFPKRIPVLI